jgi:hypothetical protein
MEVPTKTRSSTKQAYYGVTSPQQFPHLEMDGRKVNALDIVNQPKSYHKNFKQKTIYQENNYYCHALLDVVDSESESASSRKMAHQNANNSCSSQLQITTQQQRRKLGFGGLTCSR